MWVNILHRWEADAAAWEIIAAEWPEPPARSAPERDEPDHLAKVWSTDPDDLVNAREYAEHLERLGDLDRAQELIVKVAARSNAPGWFLRKAARIHAASGNAREAVELFLREKEKPHEPRKAELPKV